MATDGPGTPQGCYTDMNLPLSLLPIRPSLSLRYTHLLLLAIVVRPDFTPTLIKNQQRDSISGSPGSLPLRTSLPTSPPRSVAARFVIPPPPAVPSTSSQGHQRTTSLSSVQGIKGSPAGSPRLGNIPLPISRNFSGAGMGTSGVSDSSSIRQGAGSVGSREEVSALAARMRGESIQGRSSVSRLQISFEKGRCVLTLA